MLKDEVTTVNPQWREEIDECVNNQEPDWCGALVRLVGDVASVAVHGVDGHSVHAAEGADQGRYGQGPNRNLAVEKVEEEVTKGAESKTQLVSDDKPFTTKPVRKWACLWVKEKGASL